jgi:glutamate 5-kinase
MAKRASLREVRRVVFKFGSGVLTGPRGVRLARGRFKRIAAEIAALQARGCQCVIVSSGAVAAGLEAMGLAKRPEDLSVRQACAALGQPRLMRAYQGAFANHRIAVAQLLLTHDDIDSRIRAGNARRTLERLLAAKIVPVVNENDSVAVEELRFGDNDRLSAEVAMLVGAELLVILTSVEGLLDASGAVVPRVADIDAVASLVREETGRLSVGGMVSKLEAVRLARDAGIPAIIASGLREGVLPAAASGEPVGTFFPVTERRIGAK